jgi:hypothetical protein
LAALAYRIEYTGAQGGIVVSPLPLQEGAEKVAQASDIRHVILSPESTRLEYILKFLNQVMVGVHDVAHLGESVVVVKRRGPSPPEPQV